MSGIAEIKMANEIAKWTETAKIAAQKHLTYKVNFLLMLVGPTIIFFFVKYNIWSSIFAMEGVSSIQGYDRSGMLQYQAWVMIVGFLGQGFNSMNMAHDIRLGRISTYLVYPFDFWKFQVASYLGFLGIQCFIATVTLCALRLTGILPPLHGLTLLNGVAFTMVVGMLWFSVQYTLGLVAFWLEEVWVLRVIFIMMANFMSGAIFPLEMFPETLRKLTMILPFPYMTYVPVKILQGSYQGGMVQAWAALVAWLLVMATVAGWVWRRGLKLYTAAGM